jgi:hypothetical protein
LSFHFCYHPCNEFANMGPGFSFCFVKNINSGVAVLLCLAGLVA